MDNKPSRRKYPKTAGSMKKETFILCAQAVIAGIYLSILYYFAIKIFRFLDIL